MVSGVQLITVLGSTGSIGKSTLSVLDENPKYRVFALSAHSKIDLLFEQCLKYRPQCAVVSESKDAKTLTQRLIDSGSNTEVLWGAKALVDIAAHESVDIVMAAIVGAAGLASSLAAAKSGKKLLLANKEALVMSGSMLITQASLSGASIIPIDSEHNAIFQCLPSEKKNISQEVHKVVLTGSGGPFLQTPLSDFAEITPQQACRHPTWSMGQKISVDSATMMNKGLEYIEACLLFGLPPQQVEVIIHPQSVVHSLVYYRDGSVLAQLGVADMRIPIAHGLAFPERIKSGAQTLDLAKIGKLEFFEPDTQRFPCLKLGMEAAAAGGIAPTLLNAANEVAVAAFLAGQIRFTQISEVLERVLAKIPCGAATSLAIIHEADSLARKKASELILNNNC